jgi:8-oxo-dGTP pyrophosphatase MutT (NUDIX family)
MSITHFCDDAEIVTRYSRLFRPANWGVVAVRFHLSDTFPPDRLTANGNVVPCVDGKWIVVRLGDGRWTVPGGTRDPGEATEAALRRELAEEAGAAFDTFRILGCWRCVSTRRRPYRPHVPHPLFYRVVVAAEAHLIGEPTVGENAETVVEVGIFPLVDAVERLRSSGRRDLAELYLLAASLVGRS